MPKTILKLIKAKYKLKNTYKNTRKVFYIIQIHTKNNIEHSQNKNNLVV